MDSEQIAAKRLRRRRIAVRAVGAFLLVFSIAACLLAVYVISLMVTAPSGTYAAIEERDKIAFWHSIVVMLVLLAGSVGLIMLRRWGMVLTIVAAVAELLRALIDSVPFIEVDTTGSILGLAFQLPGILLIVFLVSMRRVFVQVSSEPRSGNGQ